MQHAVEAADHVPARPLRLHSIGDGVVSSPSEWGPNSSVVHEGLRLGARHEHVDMRKQWAAVVGCLVGDEGPTMRSKYAGCALVSVDYHSDAERIQGLMACQKQHRHVGSPTCRQRFARIVDVATVGAFAADLIPGCVAASALNPRNYLGQDPVR